MGEGETRWGGELWAAADLVTPMAIRVAATLRLADHIAAGGYVLSGVIWEIFEAAHAQVAGMVHRVAALLKATLAPDGMNVVHSNGEAAWQEVFHFHVHLVPRWHGDDLRLMWNSEPVPPHDLERIQQRLSID
ncbi:HIT family protein [Actinomadura sp. KC345]|nr:HIT family protein [Actinomadura sp. KC345]